MTDPKPSAREEIEALCPCYTSGWEYATPQAPTEVCHHWCMCAWSKVGLDHRVKVNAPKIFSPCKWPGHPLALRLAEQVEALTKEIEGLRRLKQSVDEALNSGDGVYRP